MKTFLIHIFFFFVVFGICQLEAQTNTKTSINKNKFPLKIQQKNKENAHCSRFFVDKNGDGYNDNAPDDDGDGIPNCLDPDYKRSKMQKGKKACNAADCTIEKGAVHKNGNDPGFKNKGNK